MSMKEFSWAWKTEGFSPTAKLSLLLIADNCQLDGSSVLTVARFAKFTGCNIDEIDRVLFELRRHDIFADRVGESLRFKIPVGDVVSSGSDGAPYGPDFSSYFIYVITCGSRTKVGVTGDIENRLTNLQSCSPLEVRLFWKKEGPAYFVRLVERAAHRYLKPYRWGGEWFDVSPEKARDVVNEMWQAYNASASPRGGE